MIDRYTNHAANERTFLAWVRTAVGIVGFGLVFGRVGGTAAAPVFELGMLVGGAIVILIAFVRMRVVGARIDSDRPEEDASILADGLLIVLVLGLFALMALLTLPMQGWS